jgi:hypothetical protein
MKYKLSISVPSGIGYRVIASFHSTEPFARIGVGDVIDPRTWSGEAWEAFSRDHKYSDVLEVTQVYHHLETNKDGQLTGHVVDLFTKVIKK